MSVSWGQYTDNKAVFDRMRGGFSLSVALVPASAAASVQADRLVASFTVRDQAAEISARFDTLNSASKLTQIFTSDSRPLAVSRAQTTADPVALGKLTAGYTIAATVGSLNLRVHSVDVDSPDGVKSAEDLLRSIDDDAAGSIPGATVVASVSGVLEVRDGGRFEMGDSYHDLVAAVSVPVTVFGGSRDGQRVLAGTGGLAYNAGAGAGTVVAGGGNNLISMYAGAGRQEVRTGGGDDVIVAMTGANTINAGSGSNQILSNGDNVINLSGNDLIQVLAGRSTINGGASRATVYLGRDASEFNGGDGHAVVVVGAGAARLNAMRGGQLWMEDGGGVVDSRGANTIIGGAGAATVNAVGGDDFVFAGNGALEFNAGAGISTILGAAGGRSTIRGGAGSVIDISYGETHYVGGTGADTIAAFGGSVTIAGGAGTGVFLGGTRGHNLIAGGSGRATIFGGGDGDVLHAGGGAGDVLVAGGGAETLSAVGTNGDQKFYGGSGDDLILLGAGTAQVLAGTGSATIVAGSGTDLIAVLNGNRSNVVVQNFTSGHDFVSVLNYGSGEVARALSSATTASGSERLFLSDGTSLLFQNVTGLALKDFL